MYSIYLQYICIFVLFQKMLCHYAFPQCHIVKGFPVGLPLCYEDCIAIRDLFCYNAWALIENNKQHGVVYSTRGHFRLPNCTDLPRLQTDKLVCSHAKLTELKQDEVTCRFYNYYSMIVYK